MEIHVMQHADVESARIIEDWASENDHTLTVHRPDKGDNIAVLNPAEMDGMLVLGGPQSVNDDTPWLAAERILIRSLDKLDRPVFGICLGAQQIVRAFGAAVVPLSQPEIGRQEVIDVQTGKTIPAFEWHEDEMMALPGSTPLYTDAAGRNQGFHYHRSIVGLQFHPEWPLIDQESWIMQNNLGGKPLTMEEANAARDLLFKLLTETFNG